MCGSFLHIVKLELLANIFILYIILCGWRKNTLLHTFKKTVAEVALVNHKQTFISSEFSIFVFQKVTMYICSDALR